jgi:hypothetical protein
MGDLQGYGTRPTILALNLEIRWIDGTQAGVERSMMIGAQD